MRKLKQLIVDLTRGKRSFEEVIPVLERVLSSSPDSADDAARVLQEARESGLPDHLFVALNGHLGRARHPSGDPDVTRFAASEATVFSPDDGEATAMLPAPDKSEELLTTGDDLTCLDAGKDVQSAPDATVMCDQDAPGVDYFDPLVDETTGEDTATQTAFDSDRTIMDPEAMDAFPGDGAFRASSRAARARTGVRWPGYRPAATGSVAGVDREFREGDLLRARFELMSKLGEGGMGAVWKGKDKLKEEARDRNPFVAIKLLQGDFKAHPEAFIALQRETAKQQRLAHPNIATVFDFDRDDATGTVFMTMEVLEGQPLDRFIRKLPADGLPEDEAMPLIEQLCNGLSYAHQAGLVHSDLKPGNCFLTKDGSIKLLDFGIARASKTKSDAEGETTLFDPGQLGALTPTYATMEMFEGEDPDPRDDIYALAIMAYQLLAGKHPYGKKSAPKAKELGLTPAPLLKLSKRQNKGLARGLAYLREDRTRSVEEFLDSIARKKNRTVRWLVGAVAVLTLVVAGAFGPVERYLERQDREQIIGVISQGGLADIERGLSEAQRLGDEELDLVLDDERTVNAVAAYIALGGNHVRRGLGLLARYPVAWQERVRDVDTARTAFFDYFESRATSHFAPAEHRYDFPAAVRSLAVLDALYPDSAQVFQLRSTLDRIKRETLAHMGERYKALLSAGRLVPTPEQTDISDVLGIIRTIDPHHFLLQDRNLPFRFAEETERAIYETRDYVRAKALLAASEIYAPEDARLKGLRYDLDQLLMRIENEKRIAELELRLGQAEPQLTSLSDYQRVRDELVTLADLNPRSPVLLRIQGRLKSAFDEEVSQLNTAGQWQESEALLFEFARLMTIADITRQRDVLNRAQKDAGFEPDLAASQPTVDERVSAVEALLGEPAFSKDWKTRLKVPYQELIALRPLDSPELERVRTDTARVLLAAARLARYEENFSQAREFVAQGAEFYPGLKNFTDELVAIDNDEKAFRAKRAEEERLAQVETLKSEFRESAERNDVASAKRTMDVIRELGVAHGDEFLARTAPTLLAQAYQRLAAQAAIRDDYLNAAELARQGLTLAPDLVVLSYALVRYEAEVERRKREVGLVARFRSLEPLDVDEVRQTLSNLRADFPERFDSMAGRLANIRAEWLREYSRTTDADVRRLAALSADFSALFPGQGEVLARELADSIERRLRQVNASSAQQLAALASPLAGFRSLAPARYRVLEQALATQALSTVRRLEGTDKAAAARVLRAAKAAFPDDRELAAISIVLPLKELTTVRSQLQRGQLVAAAQSLARVRAKDPAHPNISSVASRLAARREKADAVYAEHVALTSSPLGYQVKDDIRELYRQATVLCADCGYMERHPPQRAVGLCHPGLAGYGARRAGECWDRVGRSRGPILVVVPAGTASGTAFAIGKYELSQRDLNLFCEKSSRCKVVLGSKSWLPATGIPASLAEEYASWLSEQVSRALKKKVVYRLPTAAEWEYAAGADGSQPDKKFNCRVTSGGNIIAGHELVDARSGQENGWGLANYVGNAQELVRSGSGFAARGGDYEMPLTRCDVTVSEPHDGTADATTGFRLVRELG